MKKYWLLLILPALMLSCTTTGKKAKPFTLKGEITAYESGWIHMLKREKGQFITLDSTMVETGVFTFTGQLEQPLLVYLRLEGQQNYVTFFLEPGDINLSVSVDDLGNPAVTGSKSQEVYQTFQDDMKSYDRKLSKIYSDYLEAQKDENQALMDELKQQYDSTDQEKNAYIVRYIKDNSNSVVSAFIALRNLYMLELSDLEGIVAGFDPGILESSYGIDLNERLTKLRNVQIGKQAPDFTMNDSIGNPVALSSLSGKYLLIDFWASWCGPCRRENPNVVAAYQKYHAHGFDILGVSLDNSRDNWIKAIHDDNLTWHHVSDLAGWGNEAAALYAVNSIPSSVLLDPNGVIIARNLREEALHEKLEEIFGSKDTE